MTINVRFPEIYLYDQIFTNISEVQKLIFSTKII